MKHGWLFPVLLWIAGAVVLFRGLRHAPYDPDEDFTTKIRSHEGEEKPPSDFESSCLRGENAPR